MYRHLLLLFWPLPLQQVDPAGLLTLLRCDYLSCLNDSDVVLEHSVHVDFEDLFDGLSAEMAPLLVVVLVPNRRLHHHDRAFVADAAMAARHDDTICHVTHAYDALLQLDRAALAHRDLIHGRQ